MNTVSVPAGQRTNITLPDGTNVWLNARTTYNIRSLSSQKQRTVFLKGEAYFDVTKKEKKLLLLYGQTNMTLKFWVHSLM